MKNILFISLLSIILFSCEDKIDISKKLSSGKVALVVDAFINNLPDEQIIKLGTTQYYFDNSGPKGATGAIVKLIDLSNQISYPFVEKEAGLYYSGLKGDSMLKLNHNFQLLISYNSETFVSYSQVNRIVPIDSIKFELAKKPTGEEVLGKYDAEFFATDAVGAGDRYFVRHYKNGQRSLKSSSIGLGYDASAFPNGITDGIVFTLPLRRFFINENLMEDKWKDGDKLKVELYSITEEASLFLSQVKTQSTLGDGGPLSPLFSPPPANVPTNIINPDANGNKAVGFFCTSAVSYIQTTVPNKAFRNNPF